MFDSKAQFVNDSLQMTQLLFYMKANADYWSILSPKNYFYLESPQYNITCFICEGQGLIGKDTLSHNFRSVKC